MKESDLICDKEVVVTVNGHTKTFYFARFHDDIDIAIRVDKAFSNLQGVIGGGCWS